MNVLGSQSICDRRGNCKYNRRQHISKVIQLPRVIKTCSESIPERFTSLIDGKGRDHRTNAKYSARSKVSAEEAKLW
eukprot:CAMPEP_0184747962 /NCGR_PEP_ID=MMETSP0315-20130426/14923_1 /TAXON_ID=101924 /ORGANISM="Rhodosorus marinus, Strain UTEX LB 2760" /LENGTH=76 /DNA_ID=CAMNT_0027222139 /DNA_START=31 /DNA_END=258 /DNA_ORIENTATION=-